MLLLQEMGNSCVHEKQKTHKCTICNNSFAVEGKLKAHKAYVHEKQKAQKCTICDSSSFTAKGSVRKHIAFVLEK